ncbi:PglL family O-oligosaccharyltransferase [Piscinibacter sp.]|uniref:PglL family O-oligosaccharyltransferase n=1 Tax=Piscinibacter sp. TaxID=1903157 RepID=UPI002CCB57EE|nr:Wzy polymerase domain-containing protein [Albitalea sp.]HUG22953.1 Wzy polymerase domain-containing protein [Albitalea sp.]
MPSLSSVDAALPRAQDSSFMLPALMFAVAAPALLAFNLPPSATLLNQALALVAWGVVGTISAAAADTFVLRRNSGLAGLLAAFALLILAAVAAPLWAGQPTGLAWSAAGMTFAALVLACTGASARASGHEGLVFGALCWAWLVAGLLSTAIGIVQVFAPDWADGNVIAAAAFEGRASGNLRQPNHLSSLLLWALIGTAWLAESGALRRRIAAALATALLFGVVLSASRTGIVGVVLLALWGLLDRRLSRSTRAALLLAPVAYAAFWLGLSAWAHMSHQLFGGEARVSSNGDISSSRFAIWSDTLSLIAQHPWAGVGFGEFNFAWSLTPFPDRPVAFFDHTHNLPLQFAVELGLPLALLVLSLLAYALWRAFVAGRDAPAGEAITLRAAFMAVLMMVLHSQLEYPLWYAYFLLPTALVFGLCLGGPPAPTPNSAPRRAFRPLVAAGILVALGGVVTVVDYMRVVAIFSPSPGAAPLPRRIADGQRSLYFAHHAAYAAVTTAARPSDAMPLFSVATHYLLDTRLMMSWATALAETGDLERARHIAQRLREFRNEDAQPFFAPCHDPAEASFELPFQCTPPSRPFDYRDFR